MIKNITTKQLKDLWIKFYTKHDHTILPSSSVVPENDASVLFTTAGMQPLVPYLLGQKHPSNSVRLANYQACIRTNDIESVGDDSHLTFFEMLGRWSLGDYDKLKAIEMSFEFLTSKEYLEIPINRLAVTVFEGDENLPRDTEAYDKWLSLGIKPENIFYLSKEHNWWALGDTGPCGTDSEMFYITDNDCENSDHEECSPASNCQKYLEIGNDVFMSFVRNEKGELSKLQQQNIDTGMGLERNVLVLNGYKSVYETDAFSDAIALIEQLSDKKYGETDKITRAIRIIADHMRTSTMVLGDPTITTPSNTGRGYVLRRLIRRSVRYAIELGFKNVTDLKQVSLHYINKLSEYYASLSEKQEFILSEIEKEIVKFNRTIGAGLREVNKVISKLTEPVLSGAEAFRFYDTFGFPIELTQEVLKENNIEVNMQEYEDSYALHQEKSRGNSDKVFKSGLAGSGQVYNRYHTATHLLHAVLREKFGESVKQAGSAITDDRMRFDFTFERKLTPEEVKDVELKVNEYIQQSLPVKRHEMKKEQAIAFGAIGLFVDKYGDDVSVYSIGDISKEFCAGPHVDNTSEIGEFKIQKEESSSAGVRRIKAVIN